MNKTNSTKIDIIKVANEILNTYPNIQWQKEISKDCICLTYHNNNNPRFPLIVCVHNEDGIFVNLSQCGSVVECSVETDAISSVIDDILTDKIAVAIAYPNEETFNSQTRDSMMRSFVFESNDDESDFEDFVKRVFKPRSLLGKLSPLTFHGIIEISDWSGKRYHKIYRK